MKFTQVPRASIRRILFAAILGFLLLAGTVVALLAAADSGLLERPIQRWASHRLGRAVTFKLLRIHLLSLHPRVDVEGLSIANPSWIRGGTLAEVGRLSATFRPSALLRGSLEPTTLAVDRLTLHLVRVNAIRNNWTFGKTRTGQRAFGFLRSTQHLTVTAGQLDWIDRERRLSFRAVLAHQDSGAMPFLLEGEGKLDGIPLRLSVRGGSLHGASVDEPYPFVASLIDGSTIVHARGTSGDAFDLTRFKLAIEARGPNLADLGYLFNLRAPNSSPFKLVTVTEGDEARFTFSRLRVRFGGSDIRGWIRSDHTTERHRATAELWSAVWTKDDVRAVLAPIPPRVAARSRSGAAPRERRSPWILSETPFPIENLRSLDLQARVHVGALRGYSLPLNQLDARVALANGKLTYSSIRADFYGGSLSGSATLDTNQPMPKLTVTGAVSGVQLAHLPMHASTRLSGELALTARLSGVGRSIHEAASNASGPVTVRILRGSIPPAAPFMIGGDTLRALRSVGDVRRPMMLDCVSANFDATGGRLVTDSLAIKTSAGDTIGRGVLDLHDERLNFTLRGRPSEHRPFQLAMPILVQGPAKQPSVSVLPAHNAAKLGLKGRLGIVMSPLAALLPIGKEAPVIAQCSY